MQACGRLQNVKQISDTASQSATDQPPPPPLPLSSARLANSPALFLARVNKTQRREV